MIDVQRFHQLACVALIVLGGYIVVEALSFHYYTRIGPGPGFFPLWIGAAILVLSFVWLFQVTRERPINDEAEAANGAAGAIKIGLVLAALIAFAMLLNVLGFVLTMFALMMILIRSAHGGSWALSIAISLGASVGVFYLFRWLEVFLPVNKLDMLQWLPF